ncbi:hypothetical protein ACQR1I_03975 [Bradyrhizobium sp. HKCCYLS2038]|uniref:hypothetical protein n=1 Tax=unclassified Bradyrhizobium TaxID=2631580 RepID=UPI003EB6D6EE
MFAFALIAVAVITVCWFWIRPILRSRPALHELYRKEESLFAGVREKFAGIKQKLSTAVVISVSAAVSVYDFLGPVVSGVDVSPLAAQVPSWAWPLALIATTALFQFLRNLADHRHDAELDAVTTLGQAG